MTAEVWTLMAAELGNLKRWCWEREFKVIWDFMKLWTLLYWSYLRPTVAKTVKFAAEDSLRGASNNLKVIVPAALSHVCRNSRWSWESATKQLHDNIVRSGPNAKTFLRWSPKRLQSLEALCRQLNCFRTLNTSPGIVGGERTSANATSCSTAGLPSFPPL